MLNQRGFSIVFILLGLVAVIAVTSGIYYLGKFQIPKPQPKNPPVISETQQPTPTASPILNASPVLNSVDETANWKTYTNRKIGYNFKYPPTFWISSVQTNTTGEVSIGDGVPVPGAIGAISIQQDEINKKISFDEWINDYFKKYSEYQIALNKVTTVGPYTAQYVETSLNENQRTIFIFINKNNAYFLRIDITNISPEGKIVLENDSLKKVFNQILSTFKFN